MMQSEHQCEGEPLFISFAFWDRKLGPFLDAAGVQNIAALSEDELRICEEFGHILALPTVPSGDVLYPAFQFGTRGDLLPGLREIVEALKPGRDGWDIALWLTTVRKAHGGKRAIDLIRAGRSNEAIAAARGDGEHHSNAVGS